MTALNTALEKALPIVAAAYGESFGVKIVLSGSDAYTDGKTIVLPLLSSMSDLQEVLFGYLAHEASHVRDSDFDIVKQCRSEFEHSVLNIIEDVRIEKLIQDVFPGTQFTLDAMWTYIVEQGMSPPAKPDQSEAAQLCQYLLHRLNAEALNRTASDSLAAESSAVVQQTFPEGFFIRLDGLFGKYLNNLSSTADCLALTRAILKALQDAEDEEQQPPEEPEKSEGDQSADGESNGSPDQDDSSQDGTGSGNTDAGSPDQSPQGDDSGNGESTPQQDSGGPGSTAEQSANSGSSDAGQGQPSPDSQANNGGTGDKKAEKTESLAAKIQKESDLPADPVEQLRGQLVDQAGKDNGGETFTIDATSVGSDASHSGDTGELSAGVLASSAIRARLLGLLQAKNRQRQYLHDRGKRVDGKRLTRVACGDSRVFIQREEKRRPETAVHVLLDASGSMRARQEIANHAAVSLALAVSSIPKCDIAVSMFPGVGGEVSPVVRRGQPVRPNMGRFAVSSSGGTPLSEAMLYSARELAASRKERKVLIVVTDGQPANGAAVHYLQKLIAPHVDIYSIGIGTTAVSQYFEKWSVIQDVKELQTALFALAGKFLDLN